jgi:hypothetical protein
MDAEIMPRKRNSNTQDGGAGATRMKTVELLTPEEIDQAMTKHVPYHPPGAE